MGTNSLKDYRAAQKYLEQKRKADRAREQAQSEIDAFEERINQLLRVHHNVGPGWDWAAILCMLPPPPPARIPWHQHRIRQELALVPADQKQSRQQALDEARLKDEQSFVEAEGIYRDAIAEHRKFQALAGGILAGEPKAYTEAIVEINPFAELSGFGTSIHLTVHSPRLVETTIKVKGSDIVPDEMKSLNSKGKVSTKRMPKARFHELYQDYVCSCVLRVGRELLALLPVQTVIVTALVASEDSGDQPVLSAAMSAPELENVNFPSIDPSTFIDHLRHRGDFKASRRTQAFVPISPLGPLDVPVAAEGRSTIAFEDVVTSVKSLRQRIAKDFEDLAANSVSLNL